MIIKNIVIGKKENSFHTFKFKQQGMKIIISAGQYYRTGDILIDSPVESVIEFPTPTENIRCEIMLTTGGINVYIGEENEKLEIQEEVVDRLAWFSIKNGTTSLDDVKINVIEMEEELDEN